VARFFFSELHARNLLVGGDDFISKLHHELEGKVGFFDRDQRAILPSAGALKSPISSIAPRSLSAKLPPEAAGNSVAGLSISAGRMRRKEIGLLIIDSRPQSLILNP